MTKAQQAIAEINEILKRNNLMITKDDDGLEIIDGYERFAPSDETLEARRALVLSNFQTKWAARHRRPQDQYSLHPAEAVRIAFLELLRDRVGGLSPRVQRFALALRQWHQARREQRSRDEADRAKVRNDLWQRDPVLYEQLFGKDTAP